LPHFASHGCRADALPKDKGADRRAAVVAAADAVASAIDATALAAFIALRAPDDNGDAPAAAEDDGAVTAGDARRRAAGA
jgi:hypothetical protein